VASVRVGESAPNYLTPGLDARYTPGVLFFEKHGYRRIGETCNLEVELDVRPWDTGTEEAELAARGYTIRRAEKGDFGAIRAFLRDHWPAWIAEVEVALSNRPATLHLAWKAGEVVAFAAYDANNIGLGWFGPMGTAPSARGQGLGGVLLRRCLHDQRAQGHRRAIIPWVGPIAFYAHHADAALARIFYRYEKDLV
jgi:GNAT superfamily N-acetyltransferase